MRVIFVLKIEEIGGYAEISRFVLIWKYLIRILTWWFVVTGFIYYIERLVNLLSSEKPHDLCYLTWLYFTAVTATAVGYGTVREVCTRLSEDDFSRISGLYSI
ncbi:uncharacterized protein LOC119587202 isoform X2 [Penaeus monodon]|uniref:uncharacterized protein LOC119587202 isoform X2 n=1 Tax=Penaeus monodon TaxID=6687 RepID=UPI0018A739CF|nr:uncharacterized protein LOC119587202 isoform X2 [Penaeus monodon]